MPDAVITKIKSPREEFEKERAELIAHYEDNAKKEIERIKAVRYEEEAKEELLNIQIDGMTNMYYRLPYIEKYIEWNINALSDVVTMEDVRIISNTMMFSVRDEAITLFLNYICTAEQRFNTYQAYRDDPSKAEQPLTDEVSELFLLFLDKAFKPAFLRLLEDLRQSKYRTLDVISQELNEAFNVWFQDQTEVNKKNYTDLTSEQFYPSNDLIEYIKEYAVESGFNELIANRGMVGELLEKANILYPDKMLINSTKVAQNLISVLDFNTTYGIDVTPTNKRGKGGKSIYQKGEFLVSISFEAHNSNAVTLTRPITRYEKNIIDAIESLARHNTFITAAQIYRVMNGCDHVKVTQEIIDEIESSVDYMMSIAATVDYTQHMNLNGKKGTYKLKGVLVNLYKATREVNGKVVSGYVYLAPSPLFMYARDVNQIVSVPAPMLNTRSAQRGGERASNIKFYLIWRLYTIEGQGKTIALSKILEEIGEPNPTPRQLRSIRETIESFLDLWSYGKPKLSKSAPNKEILDKSPIKGYTINSTGKKITGYTLIPK